MPTATTAAPPRASLAPLPSLEDADLVRRARDGDELAFEEIVRRYRQPLIRYSARHVGQANAEDITQHALAKAASHLRDDPRPIHLRAWLYRVAHNAAINMRTRKDFGHEELSLEIDGVPQPPELAAQRNEVREVVSELDRLPDRQRTALLLSVFEGLGYDEIAARLDTSPNSVRALLSRARVHLRKAAAAIAPLPLLHVLLKKASALSGLGGSSQGTLAAGGGMVQAKLVAVAATTVVAGAATAGRATSGEHDPVASGQAPVPALVAATPVPQGAVPHLADDLIPHVAAPKPARPAPARPPAAREAPPVEPPPVAAEPVVPEPSPAPPPAPIEETPISSSAGGSTPGTPKEEDELQPAPLPADGNSPGGGNPPGGGYVDPPPPPPVAGSGQQ